MHLFALWAEPRGDGARTMLDLAGMLAPSRFESVIERSEELGLFDLTAVEDVRRLYI